MIDPFIRNLCLEALFPYIAGPHRALQHEQRIAVDQIADILVRDNPHAERLHKKASTKFNKSDIRLQAEAIGRYLATLFKIDPVIIDEAKIPKLNDRVTDYLDILMRQETAHALSDNHDLTLHAELQNNRVPVYSMAKSIPITELRKKLFYIDIPKDIKELLGVSEISLLSLRRNIAPYSKAELINLFKKDFDDQAYLDQLSRLALPVLSRMDGIYSKLRQKTIDARLITKLRKSVLSLKLDRTETLDQAAVVYFLAREAQTKIESNKKLTPIMRELLSRIGDELIFKLILLIKDSQNISDHHAFEILQDKVSKLTGPKERAFQSMNYQGFAESIYGNDIAQPMFAGHTTLFELQTAQMQEIEESVNQQFSRQDRFTKEAEQTVSEYLSVSNVIAVPINPNDQMRFRSLLKLINLLQANSYRDLLIDAELVNKIFMGLDNYGKCLVKSEHNLALVLKEFLANESTNDLQDFVKAQRVEQDPYFQAMRSLANRLKAIQTTINIEIKPNSENCRVMEKVNPRKLAYLSSKEDLKNLQVPILAVKCINEEDTLIDMLDLYGPSTLDLETAIAFAATQVVKQSKSDKVTMVVNDLADPELLKALKDNRLIKAIDKIHNQNLLVTFSDSDDNSKTEDLYLPFDTQAPNDPGPITMPSTNSQNLKRRNVKDFSTVS